jgi:hypothetical protein
VTEYKIDIYRGRLAAGDADQLQDRLDGGFAARRGRVRLGPVAFHHAVHPVQASASRGAGLARMPTRVTRLGCTAAVASAWGPPPDTLINGMVFTTRLSGGKGGRNGFEAELRRLGVRQKNSRPGHPTTCGKVERVQQTMKKWLRAQPAQAATLADLQALLDTFTEHYNLHRPHRSLPHHATPATAYTARPKATPGSRDSDTHDRIRRDRIDDSGVVTLRHHGRLHHIGIGRTHARTHVRTHLLLLVQDLHIRVIHAATGELLRELTLDPTRDYQPTGRPPGPTKHKTRTQ